MSSIKQTTQNITDYYKSCINQHGAEPKGVSWPDKQYADTTYQRILNVIDKHTFPSDRPSILDVGCGYGGITEYIHNVGTQLYYTGIDAIPEMIRKAKEKYPEQEFICMDIFDFHTARKFDYVICNGLLNVKQETSLPDMDMYMKELLTKIFGLCNFGIAFTVFSTYNVGWFGETTFFKNPLEIMAYCFSNLSTHVKMDHSYKFYEYTTYVYR
jgi:2-polyprenyl-3-methyl-5-hydroxy-6-metoxy-1,4-benzoquinol methylase